MSNDIRSAQHGAGMSALVHQLIREHENFIMLQKRTGVLVAVNLPISLDLG